MSLGPCIICGDTNYNLSCGSPAICPKCDCGNFDAATAQKQAKVIAELRGELERARGLLTLTLHTESGVPAQRAPDAVALWREAADAKDKRINELEAMLAERAQRPPPEIWLLAGRLAGAELNYRNTYEQRGGDHIETGRAWDKMRAAGNAIRDISDSAWDSSLTSTTCPDWYCEHGRQGGCSCKDSCKGFGTAVTSTPSELAEPNIGLGWVRTQFPEKFKDDDK
jgi:hypothetical protein